MELCDQMSRELQQISEEIQKLTLKNEKMIKENGYKDIDDFRKKLKESSTAHMENAINEEFRKQWADLLDEHNKNCP